MHKYTMGGAQPLLPTHGAPGVMLTTAAIYATLQNLTDFSSFGIAWH